MRKLVNRLFLCSNLQKNFELLASFALKTNPAIRGFGGACVAWEICKPRRIFSPISGLENLRYFFAKVASQESVCYKNKFAFAGFFDGKCASGESGRRADTPCPRGKQKRSF